MRRFTKQEIELMKNKYPILGSKINIILNRTRKSIINKANRLNISYIIKRTKIIKCINCSEIISYGSKSLLCRSCYAKKYRIKQLRKHNYGKLWTNEELVYLYKNYWNGEKEKLCLKLNRNWSSITHKVSRLNIKRNINYFRSRETIKFNLRDNPSKRPEVRKKKSEGMKKFIREHPDKMLNRMLKRNKKTSLEKAVERILKNNNIKYEYNMYVKTKESYKFPDFKIKKLLIECDGKRFHTDKNKEKIRDKELLDMGYKILHFSQDMINKNIKKVERCILKKLNQLNMLEKKKLMI